MSRSDAEQESETDVEQTPSFDGVEDLVFARGLSIQTCTFSLETERSEIAVTEPAQCSMRTARNLESYAVQ